MKLYLENVDEKKTILAAKKILSKYRVKMLAAHEDFTPRITTAFTLDVPSTSVERAVIKKVDSEREHAEFFTYLNRGLKKLTPDERQLIAKVYLEKEPFYDYQIIDEMRISKSKFYRMRKLALCKLGIALNVAVFKEAHSVEKGGENNE